MEHLLCRIEISEYTSLLNQQQVGIFLAAMSYAWVQAAQTQSSLAHTILSTFLKILPALVCWLKIQCTSTPGRAMYQWMLQLLLGKLFLSLSPSTGHLYFLFINNSVSLALLDKSHCPHMDCCYWTKFRCQCFLTLSSHCRYLICAFAQDISMLSHSHSLLLLFHLALLHASMQSWNKITGVKDAAVVLGNLSSQVSWLPDFLPFRITNILYPCAVVVEESKVVTIWMVLRPMDS